MGRGPSDPPADGRHSVRYVADLESLRSHLGLDRIDLFGHSFGGLVLMPPVTRTTFGCLSSTAPPTCWDGRAPEGGGWPGFFATWDERAHQYCQEFEALLYEPAASWRSVRRGRPETSACADLCADSRRHRRRGRAERSVLCELTWPSSDTLDTLPGWSSLPRTLRHLNDFSPTIVSELGRSLRRTSSLSYPKAPRCPVHRPGAAIDLCFSDAPCGQSSVVAAVILGHPGRRRRRGRRGGGLRRRRHLARLRRRRRDGPARRGRHGTTWRGRHGPAWRRRGRLQREATDGSPRLHLPQRTHDTFAVLWRCRAAVRFEVSENSQVAEVPCRITAGCTRPTQPGARKRLVCLRRKVGRRGSRFVHQAHSPQSTLSTVIAGRSC